MPSMMMRRSDLSAAMQEYSALSSSHVSSRGVGWVAYRHARGRVVYGAFTVA